MTKTQEVRPGEVKVETAKSPEGTAATFSGSGRESIRPGSSVQNFATLHDKFKRLNDEMTALGFPLSAPNVSKKR